MAFTSLDTHSQQQANGPPPDHQAPLLINHLTTKPHCWSPIWPPSPTVDQPSDHPAHCWSTIWPPSPTVDQPSDHQAPLLINHLTSKPHCWSTIWPPSPTVDQPSDHQAPLLINHLTTKPHCWSTIWPPSPTVDHPSAFNYTVQTQQLRVWGQLAYEVF